MFFFVMFMYLCAKPPMQNSDNFVLFAGGSNVAVMFYNWEKHVFPWPTYSVKLSESI